MQIPVPPFGYHCLIWTPSPMRLEQMYYSFPPETVHDTLLMLRPTMWLQAG